MSKVTDQILTKRPLTLDEIHGQPMAIRFFKYCLEKDDIPGGGILVHGEGGSGKTTAICAFIRTVLCLNRELGGTKPCLQCLSCQNLKDPKEGTHPNVKWVQVGRGSSRGEDSLNNQVNEALEATKTGPYYNGKPHQNYKFIVVDEVQNLPVNLLQRFLYFPESLHQQQIYNVRLIFSTMNLHRVNQDTIASLRGRMVEVPFQSPSFDDLWVVGKKVNPDVPDNILVRICDQVVQVGGGYRQLINYLDVLGKVYGFEEAAVNQYLGRASREQIDHFWRICSRCPHDRQAYLDSVHYFEHLLKVCNGDVKRLYGQLFNSLLWILSQPQATPGHYEALRGLAHGITEGYYPAHAILSFCQGLPHIPLVENV